MMCVIGVWTYVCIEVRLSLHNTFITKIKAKNKSSKLYKTTETQSVSKKCRKVELYDKVY
jgi:hypothetical protein